MHSDAMGLTSHLCLADQLRIPRENHRMLFSPVMANSNLPDRMSACSVQMLAVECPATTGSTENMGLVIEFADTDAHLTNCGRPWVPDGWAGPQNLDDCGLTDGECDDGGPGSVYFICVCGSDSTDCGQRTQTECSAEALRSAAHARHHDNRWICKTAMFMAAILWLFAKLYGLREKGKGQGHVFASETYPKLVRFLDGVLTGDGANFILTLNTGIKWDSSGGLYKMEYDDLQAWFAWFLTVILVFVVAGVVLAVCSKDGMVDLGERGKYTIARWVAGAIAVGLGASIIFGLIISFIQTEEHLNVLLPDVDAKAPPSAPPTSAGEDSSGQSPMIGFLKAYFGVIGNPGGPLSFLFVLVSIIAVFTSVIEKVKWFLGRKGMQVCQLMHNPCPAHNAPILHTDSLLASCQERFPETLEGFSSSGSIVEHCFPFFAGSTEKAAMSLHKTASNVGTVLSSTRPNRPSTV